MKIVEVDPVFDAAVIQLRDGKLKSRIKFGAFMALIFIVAGMIISLTLTVGDLSQGYLQGRY